MEIGQEGGSSDHVQQPSLAAGGTNEPAQQSDLAVTIMPTPQTANLDQVQPLESTEREAQLRSAEI
jgi:hypothetical protein